MPQRQQMPFNWFMPPDQMGPFQRPPVNPMMNMQMRPMRQMGQMGQMRPMRQMGQMGSMGFNQGRQGGGLLARILGKKPPAMGGFPGMYPMAKGGASGGSFLQSLTNPTAISGFLNNTQQVLKAAQQIGPMVSQYGPLVRNLPAMWRLYRGLKDAGEDNDTAQNEESDISITEDEQTTTSKKKSDSTVNSNEKSGTIKESGEHSHESVEKSSQSGRSIPRLFI